VGSKILNDSIDTPLRSNAKPSRQRGVYEGEIEPAGVRGQELQMNDDVEPSKAWRSSSDLPPLKIFPEQETQSSQKMVISPITPDSAFENGGFDRPRRRREPPVMIRNSITPEKENNPSKQSMVAASPESHETTSTQSSANIREMLSSEFASSSPNNKYQSSEKNYGTTAAPLTTRKPQKNRLPNYQSSKLSNTGPRSQQQYQSSAVSPTSSSPQHESPESRSQQQRIRQTRVRNRNATYVCSRGSITSGRSRSVSSTPSVASTRSTSTGSSTTKSGSRSTQSNQDPEEERLMKLNFMATRHADDGEYEQALILLKHVLQGFKDRYEDKHPRVAATHHNLGVVYSKKALLVATRGECVDLALYHYQTAARCARDALGKNHPNVATTLTKMGLLLLQEQAEKNALQCFEEALRIRLIVYGPRHEFVATVLNNIGVCYLNLGEYDNSYKRLEQAIDIQELLVNAASDDQMSNNVSAAPFDELRDRQLELADTLCNLGGLNMQNEDPEGAARAFKAALGFRKSVLQREDPLLIQTRSLYDMARAKCTDLGIQDLSFSISVTTDESSRFGSEEANRSKMNSIEEEWSDRVMNESASTPKRNNSSAPLPLSEIVLSASEDKEEGDDFDSIEEHSPRRIPNGSTKVSLSPHKISWSPTKNNKDYVGKQGQPSETANGLSRTIQNSYETEENCMIGRTDHLSFNPFVKRRGEIEAPHELLVIQPSIDDRRAVVKPLISRKTASMPKSAYDGAEEKLYDATHSPALKVQSDDSMYDFTNDQSSCDDADNGIAPIQGKRLFSDSDEVVLSRDMLQDPGNYAAEIHHVASNYLKRNRVQEAIYLFETILMSQRRIYGDLHEEVGSALHNVGIVYLRAERHEEALETFEKAVRVRKGALGNQAPDVAVSLIKVGICNLLVERFDLALVAFREALSVRRHSLGALHPSLARVYNNIGCVHVEFNEIREARRAFEGALDIQRNALCNDPENSPLQFGTATTLSNLGYLYSSRDQFGKAALLFKEALSFQESVLGLEHPTVLSTLDNLADSCARSNDSAVALKCYNEIIRRLEVQDKAGAEGRLSSRRAEAVVLYKMSRVSLKQNDRESALEKLHAALRSVRAIKEYAKYDENETRKTERLERGIGKEIEQLDQELKQTESLDWV